MNKIMYSENKLKMKKTIIVFIATAFVALGLLTGCNTKEEKVADAQEKVADAKEDLADKKYDAKVERQVEEKEWQEFVAESNAKIAINNEKIGDLKIRMKKSGQMENAVLTERIINLEKRNTELRKRMEMYDSSQSNWDAFKKEFSKDMENLGQAIEDLTVDSDK